MDIFQSGQAIDISSAGELNLPGLEYDYIGFVVNHAGAPIQYTVRIWTDNLRQDPKPMVLMRSHYLKIKDPHKVTRLHISWTAGIAGSTIQLVLSNQIDSFMGTI